MRSRRANHLFISALIGCGAMLLLLCTMGSGTSVPQVLAGREPEAAGPALAATPSASERYTAHLPLVLRSHCPAADLVPSPFSIQIASLDQVVEPTNRSTTRRRMTEAEWVAVYSDTFPTLLDALEASGAEWTRVRINWSWIQPQEPPADYVWGPYHDEKLGLVAETGLEMIAVVADAPDWAAPTPCAPISPTRMSDFADFLTALVTRYSQPPYDIHHWELFNEPDGVDPDLWQVGLGCWGNDGDQFAEMLSQAYGAIKAADPEATVIMGGIAYDSFTEWGGVFNRYFPDDVMAHQGDDYVDALSFHYFPDFAPEWERWVPEGDPPTCGLVDDGDGASYEAWGIDLVAKTNHYRNRMATCFDVDRPVWVTELAEHGYAGDEASLAQQARYVIQGYVRGLAAGIENITWYALTTPADSYEQALLYDDLSPKPAYFAYQTMAAELEGYAYARTRRANDNKEAYVFATPCGREKTVAWGSGTLIFPAGEVRVVDREGGETVVADGDDGAVDGVVTLALSEDPVFVEVMR